MTPNAAAGAVFVVVVVVVVASSVLNVRVFETNTHTHACVVDTKAL